MEVKQALDDYEKNYPKQTEIINRGKFVYRYHKNSDTTLVLLTGGLGISDAFFKHFVKFAKSFSVLTFDYSYDYTTNAQLADAVIELLKELKATNIYLIGQSYGGFLAQVIAKRYPEKIKGMIVSNTGCLSAKMDKEASESMLTMLAGMKKMVKMLGFLPIGIMKPTIIKKIVSKCQEGTEQEKHYIKDLMKYALKQLNNKHEIHMCSLMMDLMNEWNMTPEDFITYRGKVLLLLSIDDDTFNESTKKALIQLMPDPEVRTDIDGGHLSVLLRVDSYVKAVEEFIRKVN